MKRIDRKGLSIELRALRQDLLVLLCDVSRLITEIEPEDHEKKLQKFFQVSVTKKKSGRIKKSK